MRELRRGEERREEKRSAYRVLVEKSEGKR
jgi:hypothetical protein